MKKETYDLKLDGDDSKVQDLDSWPQDKVGLKSWDVHIPELANQIPPSTSFSEGHESEESNET